MSLRSVLAPGLLLGLGLVPTSTAQVCVNPPPGTTGCAVALTEINQIAGFAPPGTTVRVWPKLDPSGTAFVPYEPFSPQTSGVTYFGLELPDPVTGVSTKPAIDALLPNTSGDPSQTLGGHGILIASPVVDVRIDNFTVLNGGTGAFLSFGGGVFSSGSDPELTRLDVLGGVASSGGGGIAIVGSGVNGDDAVVTDCLLQDCEAFEGGGLYIDDSDVFVATSDFDGNGAVAFTVNAGGGAFVRDASVTFNGCRFFDNEAFSFGGGIAFEGGDPLLPDMLTVIDSEITGNVSRVDGGGVWSLAGVEAGGLPGIGVFDSTLIADNLAERNGGGVCAPAEFTTSYDSCRILRNTAGEDGGGIWAFFSPLASVSNTTFADNAALGTFFGGNGGAIWSMIPFGSPAQELTNVLLLRNSAVRDGGAVFADGSDLSFLACTFNQNVAGRDGGGLFTQFNFTGGPLLDSSILFGDFDANGGFGKEIFLGPSGAATTRFLDWDDGTAVPFGGPSTAPPCTGAGCFNDWPFFVVGPGVAPHQTEVAWYLDQGQSPCVNAGNPLLTATLPFPPHVTSTTDPTLPVVPDGTPLPPGNPIDMGFHYNGVPGPPVTSAMTLSPSGPLSASVGGSRSMVTTVPGTPPGFWVLTASVSGSFPATWYGGVKIPVAYDFLTQLLLTQPTLSIYQPVGVAGVSTGTWGPMPALTPNQLTVNLVAPPAALGPLAGFTMTHATVFFDVVGGVIALRDPSNAVTLPIVP